MTLNGLHNRVRNRGSTYVNEPYLGGRHVYTEPTFFNRHVVKVTRFSFPMRDESVDCKSLVIKSLEIPYSRRGGCLDNTNLVVSVQNNNYVRVSFLVPV